MVTVPAYVFENDKMFTRGILQAKLPVDQVDSIYEATEAVPQLAETFSLASGVEDENFTTTLIEALQDEGAQERILTALSEDPSLVDQINTIIARDPNEFSEILPRMAEPDADIADILQGRTTPEEVTAHIETSAAENDAGLLGGFGQKILDMFENFDLSEIGGNMFQFFADILIGLQGAVVGAFDGLFNSLSSLDNSDSVMVEGNSHPTTGTSAQLRERMPGGNVSGYDADGQPIKQQTSPDAVPQPDQQPNQPRPDEPALTQ